MIYDNLENIQRYRGISKYLDLAVDFLAANDLRLLPLGRTEIMGEDVFANVMEAQAQEESIGKFEIHRKYMDIQIDIEGTEMIQIGLGEAETLDCFNEQTDFGTVSCSGSASCVMGPGRFIICMGEEPHKPGIVVSEERFLKKCVIKVAVR